MAALSLKPNLQATVGLDENQKKIVHGNIDKYIDVKITKQYNNRQVK